MRRRFALLSALLVLAALIGSGGSAADTQPRAAAGPLDRLCSDYLSGSLTIEVLGDSIMYGTGASTNQRTWANRVGRLFEPGGGALWVGAMPGSVIVDYLPGGTHYGHTEFARAVRPTVVVWNWRVNDQYRWEHNLAGGSSPAQLRNRYLELATHIRAAAPDTTFIVVNPPRVLGDWGTAVESQYIGAMWEAKNAIPAALWLDLALYAPTTMAQNDIGLTSPDGIHQSDWGQAVTAGAVHQRIHATCTR